MEKYYSSEKNIQMLIQLMKAHGVRKIVASPGATNVCLIGSLQQDSYFTLYSSVDERSAAYIACGLAAETGEPIALSCTGATASRNYIPGLTEAYYRHLPILAITATQHLGRIGNYTPQVIDRTSMLNDMVVCSVQALIPSTSEDEWALNVQLNRALIALRRNGGGPVHINLMTNYSKDFSVKELPPVRAIHHVGYQDDLPVLREGKIGIYVGAHEKWDESLTMAVNKFCEVFGAVVFCDHTSNYKGKFRITPSLVCSQEQYDSPCRSLDTMIYIGYVSGAAMGMHPKEVWRVNPDGEIRDNSHKLTYVFEMEEKDFFSVYVKKKNSGKMDIRCSTYEFINCEDMKGDYLPSKPTDENSEFLPGTYFEQWQKECSRIAAKVPELPFSNGWLAQQTAARLPEGCVLHLGILNSLRMWNFFEIPESVYGYSNTGGFGIDGGVSSLMGASLAQPQRLFFGVVGDLAFFYDMNVLGNRHFGKNVRLLLVNNGRGTEFRNYAHPAARFEEDADDYMAAAGHFGKKSPNLVKHYAEDLGFEYMSASGKAEYLDKLPHFLTNEVTDAPMLFEIFTDSKDESDVLEIMYNLESTARGTVKKLVKGVLGEKGVETLKNLISK